jgi:cell division protein DivIC
LREGGVFLAKKRRYKLRLTKRAVVIGLVAVLAFAGVQFYKLEEQISAQQKELEGLQTQIEAAKDTNEDLQTRIDSASTPDSIEQLAREKLGWVKDGEILFVPE